MKRKQGISAAQWFYGQSFISSATQEPAVKTLRLPDGYNGHTELFFAEPIARDGDLVKLRCARPGKEYLIAWKDKSVLG